MAVQSGGANSSLHAPAFAIAKFRAHFLIRCCCGAATVALCSVSHWWQKQFSAGVLWPVGPGKN